jgi:hypothetical protein
MVLFALAACSGPDHDDNDATPDGEIVAFDVTLPHETAPLVRQVHVETDRPSTVQVAFTSGEPPRRGRVPRGGDDSRPPARWGSARGLTYDVTVTATFPGNEADATTTTTTTVRGPTCRLSRS